MELIGAAALIAVAVVVAAVLYGRTHGAAAASNPGTERDAATALQAALAERSAGLDRRADSITRREEELRRLESELDRETDALAESRAEFERRLERLAGISGAKAKQLLLQEIEEQAKHDSARRIRQI